MRGIVETCKDAVVICCRYDDAYHDADTLQYSTRQAPTIALIFKEKNIPTCGL